MCYFLLSLGCLATWRSWSTRGLRDRTPAPPPALARTNAEVSGKWAYSKERTVTTLEDTGSGLRRLGPDDRTPDASTEAVRVRRRHSKSTRTLSTRRAIDPEEASKGLSTLFRTHRELRSRTPSRRDTK